MGLISEYLPFPPPSTPFLITLISAQNFRHPIIKRGKNIFLANLLENRAHRVDEVDLSGVRGENFDNFHSLVMLISTHLCAKTVRNFFRKQKSFIYFKENFSGHIEKLSQCEMTDVIKSEIEVKILISSIDYLSVPVHRSFFSTDLSVSLSKNVIFCSFQ
uniref:Uncharacterized protein n=1 Tax=Parascaris univalens TaxID=6257 RepID=A0A915AU41_PARUN